MGRKKKEQESIEVIEQEPATASNVSKPQEPIYLRETLFGMDEIRKYGLNQYFLRAILKGKYYSLREAEELIRKAL